MALGAGLGSREDHLCFLLGRERSPPKIWGRESLGFQGYQLQANLVHGGDFCMREGWSVFWSLIRAVEMYVLVRIWSVYDGNFKSGRYDTCFGV